ncbi:hypothetical protein D3C81_1206550 [compost metagenome]
MDQECHRVLLAFLIVVRLDHITVHGFVVPPLERELLELTEVHVRQHLAGALGDRTQRRTGGGGAREHLIATLERIAAERQHVAGDVEGGNAALAHHLAHRTIGHGHGEQRVLAHVLRGGVDGAAVGRQRDAVCGAIPLRGDLTRLAAGQVQRDQAEAVSLETRALHRAVEQGLAVGAEHRAGIPCRVGGGQVDRCLLAGGVELVQIEVGRPRLLVALYADAGHHRLAVRRPGEIFIATKRLGRRIAGQRGADCRGALDGSRVGGRQRCHEQRVAAAIGPGVPMAHEHAVEHLAAGLGRLFRFQTLAGAGQIRAAVLEHAGAEHHAVALRRDVVAVHIGGEIGQLARRATGQRHGVQLLAAVLGAEEVDALAIGGDRGRVDVPAFR